MHRSARRITRSVAVGLVAAAVAAAAPISTGSAHAAVSRGMFSAVVRPGAPLTAFSTTGAVTMTRPGPGRYSFSVANLGGVGHGFVSVLDLEASAPPICTVSGVVRSSSRTRLTVRCWDTATGQPVDAAFSLLYTSLRPVESPVELLALTTASTASSTPSRQFRNPGTGKAAVRRLAKGSYRVRIPGMTFAPNAGVVLTSATGTVARWCNPVRWAGNDRGGTDVFVECRRRDGSLTNATFSLLITNGSAFGLGEPSRHMGALWSSRTDRTADWEAVGSLYSYNSFGAVNRHRSGVEGLADVAFPEIRPSSIHDGIIVQTVAYGPHRCGVKTFTIDGTGAATLTVVCRSAAGVPVDSSFVALAAFHPPVAVPAG